MITAVSAKIAIKDAGFHSTGGFQRRVFWFCSKMKTIFVFSIAALIFANSYARLGKPRRGLIVKTKTGGSIQGIVSKSRDGRDFYEWLGIPYAEPPVGELRYASPKPKKPWDAVKDGSKHESVCTQYMSFGAIGEFKGTEDCLYLNVHVPKLEGSRENKLPVMVWIHGGAFEAGGSNGYGPDYFMDEDVVLVTINYRLGTFGFLSTGDEHIRGNMGLKDQALALKWVHENIEAFGGDSKKVTVFGESAGYAAVAQGINGNRTLSPMTKRLFQKAIAQSGTAGSSWSVNTVEDARATTLKFASKVGCNSEESAEVAKCLRSKTADEIIQATLNNTQNWYGRHPQMDGMNSRPCIEAVKDEEAFLTEHPLDIIAAGKAHRIPLMIGTLSHEGLLSSLELYKSDENLAAFETNWTINMARYLGIPESCKKAEEITTKIRNYYTPNWEQLPKEIRLEAYTKLFTDALFNLHMHYSILEQRKHSDVYPYHYSRRGGPSVAPFLMASSGKLPARLQLGLLVSKMTVSKILERQHPDYGVCHGDELPMLFLMTGIFEISKNEKDPNYIFSKQVVKFWADFAKNEKILKLRGAPFSATSKTGPVEYFEITENPKTISTPFEDRVKFLQSLNLLKPKSLG